MHRLILFFDIQSKMHGQKFNLDANIFDFLHTGAFSAPVFEKLGTEFAPVDFQFVVLCRCPGGQVRKKTFFFRKVKSENKSYLTFENY